MTCAQLAVAAADFLIASAVLFVLLPNEIDTNYFKFLSVFLLATIAVVLSHVPGGVGVFELVILTMLGVDLLREPCFLFLERLQVLNLGYEGFTTGFHCLSSKSHTSLAVSLAQRC